MNRRFRFTILGSGSSGGVPRVGNIWGNCHPANQKNRRRRSSALVEVFSETGKTTVLIDTSPDMREQLLDAGIGRLDAVLFTHDHADHTHGIDDLRVLAINNKQRVPVYFDSVTRASLEARFAYCFKGRGEPGKFGYPAILDSHDIQVGEQLIISGAGGAIAFLPFEQTHGDINSLGFRIGDLAFSSDISDVPPASLPALTGLDVWIVDSLRYLPHPSHFSVKEAVAWINRMSPKRAVLTHLHTDLDYDSLKAELPGTIEPAYDGMVIEWDEVEV